MLVGSQLRRLKRARDKGASRHPPVYLRIENFLFISKIPCASAFQVLNGGIEVADPLATQTTVLK
jgi:hypothetical protein